MLINNVIKFSLFLEENGFDTIIYTKNLWNNFFNDRETNIVGLELLICFYEDVLKYKCGINSLFFKDRIEEISRVSEMNDIEKISKKLEILVFVISNIKYNLNINLLIDKLIIDMCGD